MDPLPHARFGDTIRQARLDQDLSLETLAGQAGWTTEQIRDAEGHLWVPGTDHLFRLAYFLGLDPEALARLALSGADVAGEARE